MSDDEDYIALCERAKDALKAVIAKSEPGTGLKLHAAYNDLKRAIERDRHDGGESDLPESHAELEARERRERAEAEVRELRERSAAWRATAGELRQRLILEALEGDRLTVGQIADRMTERHRPEYGAIFASSIRAEIRKMLDRRELDRSRDIHHSTPRWLYYRPRGLIGPIAALEAQFRALDDVDPETRGR